MYLGLLLFSSSPISLEVKTNSSEFFVTVCKL